jgi:hypothetical protein
MTEISESFWNQLKEIYLKNKHGEEEWNQEEPSLRKILRALQKELDGWYEIDSPINRGGAGLVIKVRDLRLAMATPDTGESMKTFRALKFPRPISNRQDLLIAMLNKEASFLASLR